MTEWYTRMDRTASGRLEFVKVTMAGASGSKLLSVEEVDAPPFAVLSPILMPHRLDGLSISDLVRDLQEIKTAIMRQMLNSLYLANKPRTWAVDGQVNLQELLNAESGGVVRVKAPGMVGSIENPFVGAQAFPMLEYIDRVLEGRSGVSKMAQGIDADVLNGGASGTATGVAALQSAAQQRVELIARVMAETGIKRAFSLILRLVTRYQQSAKIIRLRNEWVPMDPRNWDADNMDMSTEVGLGTGNKAEQMGILAQIQLIQEGIMQNPALANGMVTPTEYYHTLAKLVQLGGFRNVDQYFRDPSQQPAAPAQQQQPDPNMMMIQAQMQVEQGKLALEREKMMRQDDRERDKLDADIALKARELEMKYGALVDQAAIRAQVDRDREAMRQQAKLMQPQQPPPGMPPNGAMQ